MMMPALRLLDLLEQANADASCPYVNIVYMTAYITEDMTEKVICW